MIMNVSDMWQHMIPLLLQPTGTRGNPVPSPSHSSPLYVQPSAAEAGATAALVQHTRPERNVEHAGSTMFDKVMEQLTAMFPHHTRFVLLKVCSSFFVLLTITHSWSNIYCFFRSHLKKFVQEFRSSSGGTLSSVPFQEMVGGVAQLILECQVSWTECSIFPRFWVSWI